MWAIFPLFFLYQLLRRRPAPARGIALMMLVMALVAAPLLIFLEANPGAEARLDQLSGPLEAVARGDWQPLIDNARGGLRLLTVEGDTLWRYNIAGLPFLSPPLGALFYLGVAITAWRVVLSLRSAKKAKVRHQESHEASALALLWLVVGLSPALITGPEASTTRAIAMQPVLYLFPALALVALAKRAGEVVGHRAQQLLAPVAFLLFAFTFVQTARLYFLEWAPRPEVQVQYEAELVAAISGLDGGPAGPVAVSTDEPNRFHDPATARLYLDNDEVRLGWFDGRSSLLLPQDQESRLLLTSTAPLHPALYRYLTSLDRDLALTEPGQQSAIYVINGISTFHNIYPQFSSQINNLSTELSTDILFGESVRYLGYQLTGREEGGAGIQAGDRLRVATLWQAERPMPESWILFTHILGPDGKPVAQADRLDVPSAYWSPGDVFVQLHEIILPADLPAGSYEVAIGFYTLPEWQERLQVTIGGAPAGDLLILPPLDVTG